ncbi:MAG: hypothetical protein OSJ45_02460 [Lachnospiraceae bacterium]|nr:hypothetical protein [Lachnospiraceae bacterium]
MDRKKQYIHTTAGILLICLLFMAAVLSPEYFTAYTDKKLLNKTEYINSSYNAYEVTYTSFTEKVKAIGRITNNDGYYNSVKINDADFDYKYINKIIRKEFNDLYKCGVLQRKLRLRANKISSCEKYMLYPSVEKDNIKGISFIKAVYKLKKGIIEVYIDEEYHKIYDFVIPYLLYCNDKKMVKVKEAAESKVDVSENDGKIYGIETYYTFLLDLMEYYDLETSGNMSLYQYADNIYYDGFIKFSDDISVEAGRWNYIDTSGTEYFHIGINLKYKL